MLVVDWPHEDPRWLPVLDRWLAEPPVTQYIWQLRRMIDVTALCRGTLEQLRAALARTVAPPPPIADDLAALVAWLTPRATRDPADEDRLWAAVAAAPRDLAPRHVLADYLISHGDPRGEMFALLLHPTPHSEARANRLLSTYRRAWLAGIESLVMRTGTVWRDGMLDEARIGSIHTTEAAFALAPTHRELACVRTLVAAQCAPARYAALLDAMPQVERIGLYDPNVPAALAIRRPRWPYRIVELGSRDESANVRLWDALRLDGLGALLPDVEELIVMRRNRRWGMNRNSIRPHLEVAPQIFPRLRKISAPHEEVELEGLAELY